MVEIVLTEKQYKSLPYKDTSVSRAKTYGEIIGLLEEHGIHDYQYLRVQGEEVLSFPLKIMRNGVELGFVVKLSVPKLMYLMTLGRGYNAKKTMTYLEDTSWRVFWWYLKSKLEAIEYGISDEFKEFMYNITYKLPDKREVNLGQEVINNLEQLPKISYNKALSDMSSEKDIIESESGASSRSKVVEE